MDPDAANGLKGLVNIGQTCYMNSVLQCLTNIDIFRLYFTEGIFRTEVKYNTPFGAKGQFVARLAELLHHLWNREGRTFQPFWLKRVLESIDNDYRGRMQQDAHDFLTVALNSLHEDLSRGKQSPLCKPPKTGRSFWEQHLERNRSIVVDLFQGQYKASRTCPLCHNTHESMEAFSTVQLPIPQAQNEEQLRIQDCFAEFSTSQKLSADNKWRCCKCRRLVRASTRIEIETAPPLLIVQLRRFRQKTSFRA